MKMKRWPQHQAVESCPFCGSHNLASPPGVPALICGNCQAAGPLGKGHPTSDALTHLAAINAWNRREPVEPAAPQAAADEFYDRGALAAEEPGL